MRKGIEPQPFRAGVIIGRGKPQSDVVTISNVCLAGRGAPIVYETLSIDADGWPQVGRMEQFSFRGTRQTWLAIASQRQRCVHSLRGRSADVLRAKK